MNEVTSENFKDIYPQLEYALKNANFITFDTEFSGIKADNIKNSLFDSIKERYNKNRNVIQSYKIVQFGITAFQRIHDKNEYNAEVFNFFLFPRSIPSKTRQFLWNVPALEFLVKHGFDFNKLVYHGISYIDEKDQEILQQQIQDDMLLHNIEQDISIEEEDNFKDNINDITKWLSTANETSSFKINTSTPSFQYLMHKKLRKHFPHIWTLSGNNTIIVMKVQPDIRKILEEEESSILENALIESYIGFSKVFNLLVTLKKPMVGHNILLDLMFMYQQFYKPLPQKYTNFKNNIHKLFPIIYDTKFVSYKLKEILQPEEKWQMNSLGSIFDYFTPKNYIKLIPGSPVINLVNEIKFDQSDGTNSMKCHTAGWDAYFTGYIFIKMAHVFAVKHSNTLQLKYFTHRELMSNIKSFENCINVAHANMLYLKLDGNEPVSTRPKWLYVKTLTPKPMTEMEVYEQMSKFGSIDVKKLASKRMLVAVGNHGRVANISFISLFEDKKGVNVIQLKDSFYTAEIFKIYPRDIPEMSEYSGSTLECILDICTVQRHRDDTVNKKISWGALVYIRASRRIDPLTSAQEILHCFRQNKELYVVPYNAIHHSPSVRLAVWSGVIISGGILAWMIHQKFQKNS